MPASRPPPAAISCKGTTVVRRRCGAANGPRFVTLDVFTDRRFAGNPLAVARPRWADSGDAGDCARVQPSRDGVRAAAVRPRARRDRHLCAGARAAVRRPSDHRDGCVARPARWRRRREIVLEEGIGPIRCTVEPVGDDGGRARFALAQLPTSAGAPPEDATILAALGLAPGDLGFGGLRPSCWSAGNPFVFVPVAGLAAIGRCRADADKLDAAAGDRGVYVFCAETAEPGHAFHARMFGVRLGIREDPRPAGCRLRRPAGRARQPARCEHAITIEQGYEGRPSLIRSRLCWRAATGLGVGRRQRGDRHARHARA